MAVPRRSAACPHRHREGATDRALPCTPIASRPRRASVLAREGPEVRLDRAALVSVQAGPLVHAGERAQPLGPRQRARRPEPVTAPAFAHIDLPAARELGERHVRIARSGARDLGRARRGQSRSAARCDDDDREEREAPRPAPRRRAPLPSAPRKEAPRSIATRARGAPSMTRRARTERTACARKPSPFDRAAPAQRRPPRGRDRATSAHEPNQRPSPHHPFASMG